MLLQIKGNIEKTFGQFKGEGKSTIRFKEPPHDLCITADQIPLKNFMMVVKKIWSGEEQHVPEILNEKCIPQIKTSVTKMDILRKGDYPTLKGFPSTLQILNVSNSKHYKVFGIHDMFLNNFFIFRLMIAF